MNWKSESKSCRVSRNLKLNLKSESKSGRVTLLVDNTSTLAVGGSGSCLCRRGQRAASGSESEPGGSDHDGQQPRCVTLAT